MRNERDSIDLIWNVAELAGLFEKKSTLEGFLTDVVKLIAAHMQSDVCSIYLYDSFRDSLVLRASHGLDLPHDKQVELRVGEGITGHSFAELRPICEADAPSSRYFKIVPGLNEEEFRSFLAVPIRRGPNRIGIMVLQHRQPDHFTQTDTRAMQAIASQLATTLENAEMLMQLRHVAPAPERHYETSTLSVVRGQSVSEGFAEGRSVLIEDRAVQISVADDRAAGEEEDLASLAHALEATHKQLEMLQREIEHDLSDVASMIFTAHLLMLKDHEFVASIEKLIHAGSGPQAAVRSVVHRYVELLSGSANARSQEKAQDLMDLEHRVLRNLQGTVDEGGDYTGQVVLATDIYPSELVRIVAQNAEGLVIAEGGVTAHISILARSLGLPVVLCKEARVFELRDNTPIILDAFQGNLYVDPDDEARKQLQVMRDSVQSESEDGRPMPEHGLTKDGTSIKVMANINLVFDVKLAERNKAEGIGLYRSEFPFIVRSSFPTEDEQYHIYRKILSSMPQSETILRTLDIGGDKMMTQPGLPERNPFLGFRGIRFSLANIDIFKEQLRAMLRAAADCHVQILLPMISSVDEFSRSREVLTDCLAELELEHVPHCETPDLGIMVELPSAVECIDELAGRADFLSIGTNDLVMYMLAVDRTNERVGGMHKHYHPAVLKALARTAQAVASQPEKLSICGEMAADIRMLPFLVGIGIRKVSVEPRLIAKIKFALAEISLDYARRSALELLSLRDIDEVEKYLGIEPGQV
ncbi:MAG: phosphoenolpyruvate--protein phosphotransferase [Spirochaeta sp.]|nr:phosphoenolpyruvate--protein phosphotransferase [Spirochaeta sp.]